MDEQAHHGFRPSLIDGFIAVISGGLALTVLFLLPLLEEADTGIPGGTLSVADSDFWVVVGVLACQSVALLWATSAPRTVLTLVVLLPVVLAVVVPGPAFSLSTIAIFCAVFLSAGRLPLPRVAPLLVLAALVLAGAQAFNDFRTGLPATAAVSSAVGQALVVVGAPLLFALVLSARREARLSRTHEIQALAREQQARIEAAVSKERTAMSRELHDIAAHHMSGIALMTAAIQQQIDTDPQEAKRSAQQIRSQSTAVLEDLRRIVGLLREHPEGTRSVEAVAGLPGLVEERRRTGMDVDFVLAAPRQDGELAAGIGPLAQLVVYRMVQEALSNAAAHSPGARCVVEVDDGDPSQLTAVVHHGRAPAGHSGAGAAAGVGTGGGFGLLGLRERAELIGAALNHGPNTDGGWSVRLVVPREAARHPFDEYETPQEMP